MWLNLLKKNLPNEEDKKSAAKFLKGNKLQYMEANTFIEALLSAMAIYRVIWQQVLKREQVSNPFWLVAVLVTKFPKGLTLVLQIIPQLRTTSNAKFGSNIDLRKVDVITYFFSLCVGLNQGPSDFVSRWHTNVPLCFPKYKQTYIFFFCGISLTFFQIMVFCSILDQICLGSSTQMLAEIHNTRGETEDLLQ